MPKSRISVDDNILIASHPISDAVEVAKVIGEELIKFPSHGSYMPHGHEGGFKYHPFGNDALGAFAVDGIKYRTMEHYNQSAKFAKAAEVEIDETKKTQLLDLSRKMKNGTKDDDTIKGDNVRRFEENQHKELLGKFLETH